MELWIRKFRGKFISCIYYEKKYYPFSLESIYCHAIKSKKRFRITIRKIFRYNTFLFLDSKLCLPSEFKYKKACYKIESEKIYWTDIVSLINKYEGLGFTK